MFDGLPEGKVKFDRLPSAFFSDLLPQIDHLGELKVTLYVLWRLDRMEGDFRYLTESDFLEDTLFIAGLTENPDEQERVLLESLMHCVERGTLLRADLHIQEKAIPHYFFNSAKGRAAIEAIQNGQWRPSNDDTRVPIELAPERPNIFQLYEENIGPMTPLLAETLADAEDEYPAKWIEDAFRIAVEKNIRNWRYVEAILRGWHERGYDVRENRRDTEKTRQKYADWED
jgi:DnaD/phage-associated family protein